jgi:hypothetical protein
VVETDTEPPDRRWERATRPWHAVSWLAWRPFGTCLLLLDATRCPRRVCCKNVENDLSRDSF